MIQMNWFLNPARLLAVTSWDLCNCLLLLLDPCLAFLAVYLSSSVADCSLFAVLVYDKDTGRGSTKPFHFILNMEFI